MDIIFRGIYCKISMLTDAGIANRNTASKYLKKLEEIGVLEGQKAGREIIYRNIELGKILS